MQIIIDVSVEEHAKLMAISIAAQKKAEEVIEQFVSHLTRSTESNEAYAESAAMAYLAKANAGKHFLLSVEESEQMAEWIKKADRARALEEN